MAGTGAAAARFAQRAGDPAGRHWIFASELFRVGAADTQLRPAGRRRVAIHQLHTTALCSPTRACLLTGRNHHFVGMRALLNFDDGFENKRGRIAASAATIAEVLQP